MKGVMADVPEFILEWRRRTGADRFDEVWNGVLHMAPSPTIEHQDFEGSLIAWLRRYWRHSGRSVLHQVNVSPDEDWRNNFRIPDIVLLQPEESHLAHGSFLHGAPSVVIEIRSPDDESYEKFDFYASLGSREIWVFDRDTTKPELFRLIDGAYQEQEAMASGWLSSEAAGIELRHDANNKLGIRIAGDETTFARLPD